MNEDKVDKCMEKERKSQQEKICVECGAECEATSRKCTNCGGSLRKQYIDLTKFSSMAQAPYKAFEDIQIQHINAVGEPDMCNPNSFNNIATILENQE